MLPGKAPVWRRALLAPLLGLCFVIGCTPIARQTQPRLVVLITVDQLGANLLDYYDPVLRDGFRRLLDSGFSYRRTFVDHAVTVSHPGHATVATGMHPANHGLVDGRWAEHRGGQWTLVDAVTDSTTSIVGFPRMDGASPSRLLVTALPDWLADHDTSSRFAGIGLGQHSSLLHAGRRRGDVYWYDERVGRFVTSTYYRDSYPAWVDTFHQRLPALLAGDSVWRSVTSANDRRRSLDDTARYEADGVHTFFPHAYRSEVPEAERERPGAFEQWLRGTSPAMDRVTLRFAEEAVRALDMGRDGHTDYLTVVVSQVDEIGHRFGPRSREQLENLVQLDSALGAFFRFLDTQVGTANYLVAVTADHGAADAPEGDTDASARANRLASDRVDSLFRMLEKTTSELPTGSGRDSAARTLVAAQDYVDRVWTIPELMNAADSVSLLHRHSFRSDRRARFPLFDADRGVVLGAYGLVAQLKPGIVRDFAVGMHGSPHDYDRHVPLIFMGHTIKPGRSDETVRTVDVAPTLATIMGLCPPDVDGVSLSVAPRRRC